MTCANKRTALEELEDSILRLSTENKKRLVRLLRHMLTSDGFSEAFNTLLDENGGPASVGLEHAERFIDAWEVLHCA